MATLSFTTIPRSYSRAVQHDCWKQAIQEELGALEKNHTWDLVDCPHLSQTNWVQVDLLKLKPDGTLDRHKVRLVALGNKQEFGIDYEETFAPVAKLTTVRLILAIAASQSWPLYQMDVKNSFLHGDLKEEVYTRVPQGVSSQSSTSMCQLRRSLYDLKQAPRAWFNKFEWTLKAD